MHFFVFIANKIDALPEVVEAVKGKVEVYLDGGIRTGTDVLKALALGARAVFIGRPVYWGLACQVNIVQYYIRDYEGSIVANQDTKKRRFNAQCSIFLIHVAHSDLWQVIFQPFDTSSALFYFDQTLSFSTGFK